MALAALARRIFGSTSDRHVKRYQGKVAAINALETELEQLSDEEKKLLETKKHFTHVSFENVGGLVMPIIVELELENGTREEVRIPAEIWRRNPKETSKVFLTEAPVVRITLDPHLETADTDLSNNHYPPEAQKTRFQLYKDKRDRSNPMQEAKAREEKTAGKDDGDAKKEPAQ